MIYFTADTHFGHANILKYSKRPFSSVEQMDKIIVDNWNARVTPNDTIYHIGDFSFRMEDDYLSSLNGKKIFVKGSHDKWMIGEQYPYLREIVLDNEWGDQEFPEYKRLLVLCHYSMRSWNMSHYASWHLFGHHHGALGAYGLSFDVGVDCHDYYPISIDEVSKKMSYLSPIVDYRKRM